MSPNPFLSCFKSHLRKDYESLKSSKVVNMFQMVKKMGEVDIIHQNLGLWEVVAQERGEDRIGLGQQRLHVSLKKQSVQRTPEGRGEKRKPTAQVLGWRACIAQDPFTQCWGMKQRCCAHEASTTLVELHPSPYNNTFTKGPSHVVGRELGYQAKLQIQRLIWAGLYHVGLKSWIPWRLRQEDCRFKACLEFRGN